MKRYGNAMDESYVLTPESSEKDKNDLKLDRQQAYATIVSLMTPEIRQKISGCWRRGKSRTFVETAKRKIWCKEDG